METETIRRQVAVGGVVKYDNGQYVRNTEVKALRKSSREQYETCMTDTGGKYFFCDLPNGEYIVLAQVKNKASEAAVTIKRDAQMNLPMTWLDLEIKTG